MMSGSPNAGLIVYTPSQLIAQVNALLKSGLSRVVVEGEIASLRVAGSGHTYFELRDAEAVLNCVLFKSDGIRVGIKPADGMKVRASGSLTVYKAFGRFQLVVEALEDAGEGELLRAFLALKKKLEAEGLFDPARKPPLPKWPKRLALLTSPEGAVLHDVLTILARRFPLLPVDLHRVPVQGREAAPAIIAALRRVIAAKRCDLVLIARGGGSLSDLAAFNDEALARAIAASPLPVVSAVGHETDYTIADFVASLRAPTPSAAAECIVPDRAELLDRLAHKARFLGRTMRERLRNEQQRVDEAERMLRAYAPAHGPLALSLEHLKTQLIASLRRCLSERRQRLEPSSSRLAAWPGALARKQSSALAFLNRRLERVRPGERIGHLARRLMALRSRLMPNLNRGRTRLEALANRLREAHPQRRLARWRQRLLPAPLKLLQGSQGSLLSFGRRLSVLRERLLRSEPSSRLRALDGRLGLAAGLLRRLPRHVLGRHSQKLDRLKAIPLGTALLSRFGEGKETLLMLVGALQSAMKARLEQERLALQQAEQGLRRLGPMETLRRGYAILLREGGQVLTRAQEAAPGQALSAILADGRLDVRVEHYEAHQGDRFLDSREPES